MPPRPRHLGDQLRAQQAAADMKRSLRKQLQQVEVRKQAEAALEAQVSRAPPAPAAGQGCISNGCACTCACAASRQALRAAVCRLLATGVPDPLLGPLVKALATANAPHHPPPHPLPQEVASMLAHWQAMEERQEEADAADWQRLRQLTAEVREFNRLKLAQVSEEARLERCA
jgi:hypothetical protein